jgi:amidase
MPMSPSFDTGGWFASSPGVFRKVGDVLLEGKGASEPIRELLIADDAFTEADPEVSKLLTSVLAAADSVLPQAKHVRIAPGGLDAWRELFRVEQAWEVWQTYGGFVERHKPRLGPGIRERMAFAASVEKTDVEAARGKRSIARGQIHDLLRPGIIVALPPVPSIAPLRLAPAAELEAFRLRTFRLTCISGLSGLPQVTIPAGTVAGCPIGLSFIGWERSDEVLLDLAVRLARFCGVTVT